MLLWREIVRDHDVPDRRTRRDPALKSVEGLGRNG